MAHAAEMFDVLGDVAIYEFENEPPPSLQWLARRFERLESRGSPDGSEQWLNWVIRLPTGRLAGYVQATLLRTGASLIAYELASAHWRRGIGSAAVEAMLQELSSQYRVRRFVAVLKSANYRSHAFLQRLGFDEASALESERYRDEPDELVMVKGAAEKAV